MPVTGNARVPCSNFVCHRQANGRRPYQKAIFVNVKGRLIVVVQQTEVHCVALGERVTPIEVGGVHFLISDLPTVQTAVGILLQQVEVRQVVLKNVVVKVSK